jgi:hypothetical protein
MRKVSLVLLALVSWPSTCLAAYTILVGADVTIGNKHNVGYVALPQKLLPTEDLQTVINRSGSSVLFTSDVVKIIFPSEAFVSTGGGTQIVEVSSITRIVRKPSPFDDAEQVGPIVAVTIHQAQLLSTGKPFYSCVANFENGSETWVSYDKAVGAGRLSRICRLEEKLVTVPWDSSQKREFERTKERLQENKNVFSISLADE